MLPDYFVISIVQFCLRCFERPTESAGRASLACIDLRSGGVGEENDFFAGGGLDRFGHVRWGFFLRLSQRK